VFLNSSRESDATGVPAQTAARVRSEKGEMKMKFAKRLLMVAGAVALAGLFSVMLAPKAVHAVVATLVTVTNTVPVANPVNASGSATPLLTQSSALNTFGAALACTFPTGSNKCQTTAPVPANYTAVIQSFSGYCNLDTGSNLIVVAAYVPPPAPSPTGLFVVPGPPSVDTVVSQTIQSFGQNITGYAAGGPTGTSISFLMVTNVPQTSSSDDCNFVLSGYVVPE
jgi:hypothetical protein